MADLRRDFTSFERDLATNINALGTQLRMDAAAKGFDAGSNVPLAIALIHSEVSEALEADRKDEMDKHLQHRPGLETELADVIIRCLDLAAGQGLDVGGAIMEKRLFNRSRPYKHGGKKY